ncbi:MAG: ACP S-malonyltransferase [Peptococcaceae bacterium]|jgi:[acyl-carrier-protein] S-malonyltransferase|nr:ACP S-malonyltransferase [Peptococcaceae bacterium]MDH7525467.1 ACP S-malonyltransferase [Peptococcaceae bacterium]
MDKKIMAFVFPGQGSQYVGMGKEICEEYPAAKNVFDEAEERLGFSISELCFNGPEDELKLTVNTQPAILTTSVALLRVVEQEGIRPCFVAGHSLGEYSALVAAGALSFGDAVWLVRKRGAFMQEAVGPGKGTMAAIMGLEEKEVQKICREASLSGVVEPANFNSPGQIVIAGETHAVNKAVELAKSAGAKRAVMLPVSGPFHSSLLKPASSRLSEELAKVEIKQASIPVVANYTARLEKDPKEIRRNLVEQVNNAVLWQQSVETLLELGVNAFIEIGPGKVLSGLIKKVAKNAEMYNIEDVASLRETLTTLKGGQDIGRLQEIV